MQALSVAKPPNIWELCPASLKTNFLKYFKLFAKRLETMDPQYRILPVDEAVGTIMSVPGFVFEYNKKQAMALQKTEDFKFELQFLHHHKEIYLKHCAEFAASEYSPRSKAALESFKVLLLAEAVILLLAEAVIL